MLKKYYYLKEEYPNKGIRPIANILGIPYSCLQEWIKQYQFIELTTNKKDKFRLDGAGILSTTLAIEDELMKWICEQRRCEIGIATQEIINKSKELDENQKNKSQTALEHWVLSFLRSYSYGIRVSTHIGQKIKEGSNNDYKEFLTTLYNLRNKLGDEEDYSNIYNVDEIPIYQESISKNTIAPIGEKSVYIRTHGGEKTRITVIFTIRADGRKLPSFLVFKGEKNEKKESILNKCENCKKKKIFIACQNNSWADKSIFLLWLEKIFFNNTIINNNKKKLLILDRTTTHYDKEITEIFKEYNAHYILIPPGLTRFIQPLDVSINAPFKKRVHHWNIDFYLDTQNKRKPSELDIINAITELWYNENFITKEIIIKSFKVTGISSKLDGTEDNLIIPHNEICDDIFSPKDFLSEEKELSDIIELAGIYKNKKKEHNEDTSQPKITNFFIKNENIDKMDLD